MKLIGVKKKIASEQSSFFPQGASRMLPIYTIRNCLRPMKKSLLSYCAFHKHGNSKVQKPPSQLRFSLASIIITITGNEP